ncbi:hypothetical protein PHAVU_008G120400 [Phaseolus vulgaris]
MIPSGIMKPSRGKLPLPIIIITTCVLVFVAILYAERLSFLSSKSIFKFKPCPRQITKPKSITSLYYDISCPYIDRQFSCVKNGRNDSDYRHWEWQPEDCTFNPKLALRKLQGKKLLFVGDSLQRNQWESFLCLVEWVIPHKHKSMRLAHSVFTA